VAPPPADLGKLTFAGLLDAVRKLLENDPRLDGATVQLGPEVRGLAELRQEPGYLAAVRAGHLHDEAGVIRVARSILG